MASPHSFIVGNNFIIACQGFEAACAKFNLSATMEFLITQSFCHKTVSLVNMKIYCARKLTKNQNVFRSVTLYMPRTNLTIIQFKVSVSSHYLVQSYYPICTECTCDWCNSQWEVHKHSTSSRWRIVLCMALINQVDTLMRSVQILPLYNIYYWWFISCYEISQTKVRVNVNMAT